MGNKLIPALFVNAIGVGVTGLTPTIDIIRLDDDVVLVDGASMSEVTRGVYKYIFTAYDSTKEYFFVMNTDDVNVVNKTQYGQSLSAVDNILKIEKNRWKILNDDTMVFYDDDATTPLYEFDLKNALGNADSKNVFERVPK